MDKAGDRPEHTFYRPEIDGLRAIAVLAVVVFHFDRHWLPGGFTGVDVFFVISGYLITSIILRKEATGSFSFLSFYQRRIARLFPALLATALATLMAAHYFYTSWDYASTGAAFSASLLSIANFHLAMQGDYFDLTLDAQPLLHYWSLAVEEQYYVFYPVGFWLLLRTSNRARWITLGTLTVLSLAACVAMTRTHPVWAFYMFPLRAWELLVGGCLALAHAQKTKPLHHSERQPHASQLVAVGGILLAASFLFVQEDAGFPGWIALLPVLGTALLIHASATTGPLQNALRWRPLIAIGKASYSIYLWHWPVFAFVDYTLSSEDALFRGSLKLGLSAVLASASYSLLERPCRRSLNLPRRRGLAYGLLAATLLVLGPVGYKIRKAHYIDASDGKHGELVFTHDNASGTVMILGDSQATMYSQLMKDLAKELRLNLIVLSQAGRDPLAPSVGHSNPLWDACFQKIERERPQAVVIACHWYKLQHDPSRLERTLEALKPLVGRLILPTVPPQLPESASRRSIRKGSRPPFRESPEDALTRETFNHHVRACQDAQTKVIEVDPFFVRRNGVLKTHDAKGHSLFHDRVHLTSQGADRLKPAFRKHLGP